MILLHYFEIFFNFPESEVLAMYKRTSQTTQHAFLSAIITQSLRIGTYWRRFWKLLRH